MNEHKPKLVVCIGASAGGLKPIEEFFDNCPADTEFAFVIIQHLSPEFKSLMDQLLARHTKMEIHKIRSGMTLKPNSIYLSPPDQNAELDQDQFVTSKRAEGRTPNLPIDLFFSSLSKSYGPNSVGIILSGSGSDGSRGIKDIHDAGGLLIAQSLGSSDFEGMPKSSIQSGLIDFVTPVREMPSLIHRYSENRIELPSFEKAPKDTEPGAISANLRLFHHFRQTYGVDFSLYKPGTITRRIDRRMQANGVHELGRYVDVVVRDRSESETLYRDMLVEVTSFFRDPLAYDSLKENVLPNLIKANRETKEIRIWVCGCATGEEAYSIAMLTYDAIEKHGSPNLTFKLFATDIHRGSVKIAGLGRYSEASMSQLPEGYCGRFFDRIGDSYVVKRAVRESVIFAPNDVTRDPPFTRLDLICCRNLLIYLTAPVQKIVLSQFHFGLKPEGYLFLGPSETVGSLESKFTYVDRNWRIFKKDYAGENTDGFAPSIRTLLPNKKDPNNALSFANTIGRQFELRQSWVDSTYQDLLQKFVPPSILVDEFYEVLHCFGDASKFLSIPSGRPTSNLQKMLQGSLGRAANSAVYRSNSENTVVIVNNVEVEQDDGTVMNYSVQSEPLSQGSRKFFLVIIQTRDPRPTQRTELDFASTSDLTTQINGLEEELSFTRKSLQAHR